MIEIFDDIPPRVKENAAFMFEIASSQKTPIQMVKILNEYLKLCVDEREHEFVDFYFKMRMEELKR